ncbi:hypothetical protein RhiirC2_797514 [Rhizophagus irregularis]|uniref:Endonuclease/exonuclease/phosphatase domain-containing protein n=1 Tax=Rhizophagus irregularis TaxID=588596 RepID=A0A2N1M7Y3_9GLOM|nr:hypothetical protein RhiirC2_797514 [Rhizophagus irregularis]
MIRDLDARVDWFSTQLADHSSRIEKLEAAIFFYESAYMNNWDNPSSASPPEQQSSLPNFTHSSTTNHHFGVGVIFHSSLAMYVVKKKFFSDRLIGLTLQLPEKCNVLLIGGYIPPISSSNQSTIADCHFTLISWIRSARSSNHNVLLSGDLNADFDSFLT